MRKLLSALILLCAFGAAGSEPLAAATQYRLEAVVLVNRHGVRSPIVQSPDYRLLSRQKWPDFGVPEGYLTKRGGRAARKMGAFYGNYFRDGGLLPRSGCLPANSVWIHADNAERTIVTAEKMRNGMMPGCTYPVTYVDTGYDPLIAPVQAGVCQSDGDLEDDAIEALISSSQTVVDAYQTSLAKLQEVLDCCRPKFCKQSGLAPGCTLADLDADDLVDTATVVSENFLMEYADNLPLSDVGWGRASSPATISHINMTHALMYWASNANRYSAGYNGSNLVNQVLSSLTRAADGTGPVLSLIVAHDNNLLNVAGLIGSSWFLSGYQQSEVPPGAGIAFELWKEQTTGKLYVDIVVRAQTMGQLRKAGKLSQSGSKMPAMSHLTPVVCDTTLVDGRCPFGSIKSSLSHAMFPQCIERKPIGH